MLLAGAGMLLTTLFALQAARTGFETRNVLALQRAGHVVRPHAGPGRRLLPGSACGASPQLPGVERVAVGTTVPWRDAGSFGPGFQFTVEGHVRADGEDDPRGAVPHGLAGLFRRARRPDLAGRDFNDGDRRDAERVVIVSQSLAQRMFPNQDAVNRHLMWTDPVMKFIGVSTDAAAHRRRRRPTSTTRTSCPGPR